jgi:hypothetical protein
VSTDRDVTRIVRSWMDEGVTQLPDRVLDAVLDQLPATPQRRTSWLAWRFPLMNNTVRIALAAAAVVVVALIGIQLFEGANVGGPGPSPSPSESPTVEPTATPVPTAAALPPAGPMAVGRHSMTLAGVPLSIALSTTGWTSNGEFGIDKGSFQLGTPDSAGFILWPASAADNTYADPCKGTPLDPPAGPSVAELAAAVSTVPGTDLVSGPSAVTVGGYPAQHVVITVPEDIGCAPEQFYLWYDADPSGELGRYATALSSTIYVWIIDVDGTIVWIDGETYATSGPEAAQEVQQIVDSIQFE